MKLNVEKARIEAIRSLINSSQLISEKTREVCLFLLDYFEKNGSPVSITIGVSDSFSEKQLSVLTKEFEALCDSTKATKVNQIMQKLNIPVLFMNDDGAYINKSFINIPKVGEFANKKVVTFWLALPNRKHNAFNFVDSELHADVLLASAGMLS